jgi:hypothetical protein
MRSPHVLNWWLREISVGADRGAGSGVASHRPLERPMVIDWQRLGDDDYYTSVCTTLYET